ncbi:hypothetical protein ACVWWN_000347 [Mycobacterium sp. URHB0021]
MSPWSWALVLACQVVTLVAIGLFVLLFLATGVLLVLKIMGVFG